MMRILAAALALAACVAPARAQREDRLAPLAPLYGCWSGTFEATPTLRDERCLAPMLDGHAVRDRHTVLGAGYNGETIYAWNPETQRIEAAYYTNDGARMTGRVSREADGSLWLLDGRYVGVDGAVQMLRSRWIIKPDGGFAIETDRLEEGVWVRLMRIDYVRASAPTER